MSSAAVAVPPKANTKKAGAASGAKKPKAHPTYHEMVKEAIVALKERNGSSQIAIARFIEEKQKPNLPGNFKKLLLVQLKKLVANGKLVKVKNSFKLPPKGSAAIDGATATMKKPAPAKKASPTKKAAPVKKVSPSKKALPVKKADDKVKSTTAKRKVVAKPKPNKVAKTVAVSSPAKKAVVPAKKKTPVKKVAKKPKTIKSPVKKKAASKKK